MAYELEQVRSIYAIGLLILERQHQTLLSQPLGEQAINVGIVTRGDQRPEAIDKINHFFEKTKEASRRGAIVNLCATFERVFLTALSTSLGELRKAIKQSYKLTLLSKVKEKMLREQNSFRSLEAQFDLLEGLLPDDSFKQLTEVRRHRNEIAHGEKQFTGPVLSVEHVQTTLREALDFFGIR